ncbi:hypothetical protein A167_01377 [Alcanivorax sp. S71-1-4]|nr:hypothetical protein A167_01377 [Alcanivorax sp. S71-1-4]
MPWFQLPDYDVAIGDIKGIWEASRFDWVLSLAQHAAMGSDESLQRLNEWLADWFHCNRPYQGPNWKCGQEASIRVMHLLMAAYLLEQVELPLQGLVDAVEVHLKRIAPTMLYAVGQDNNHGTSEAAALFMGGTWLARQGRAVGVRYGAQGRKWLAERASRLIMPDGSFSQYSVNYHRVMLDTYSWVELWRRMLDEPAFHSSLYDRLKLATDWLANMVVSPDGDAPNLGANDGARLIPLTDTDYRDFRPSVQLATVIFHGASAYLAPGAYDLPLAWLGVAKPDVSHDARSTRDYPDGGFCLIRTADAAVLFRFPVFRFRPSQCDLLHVDLWTSGLNLLRDAGTYSYNSGDQWQDYFGSTEAHNTLQFDDRDQMPRLSRFLYGAWPKVCHRVPLHEQGGVWCCEAGFRDWRGAEHIRALSFQSGLLRVEDVIKGFRSHATLRWRLAPGEWVLTDSGVQGALGKVDIRAVDASIQLRLVEGQESRYYSHRQAVPVLEAIVRKECTIISEIRF